MDLQRGMVYETRDKCVMKCGISNAFDGAEVSVMFEESKCVDNNNSNDDCDNSNGAVGGFYDQYKHHTAQPCC
jgi:hypothetical protein